MTSLTIQLPDELAEKAQKAGIFQTENLQRLIAQAVIDIESKQPKLQKSGRFTVFSSVKEGHTVTSEQIQNILDEEGIL